jgi:hypothetical protein
VLVIRNPVNAVQPVVAPSPHGLGREPSGFFAHGLKPCASMLESKLVAQQVVRRIVPLVGQGSETDGKLCSTLGASTISVIRGGGFRFLEEKATYD